MGKRDHLIKKSILDVNGKATTVYVAPADEQRLDEVLATLQPSPATQKPSFAEYAQTVRTITSPQVDLDGDIATSLAALGFQHPEDEEGTFESRHEWIAELLYDVSTGASEGSEETDYTTRQGAENLGMYLSEGGYEQRGMPSETDERAAYVGIPQLDEDGLTITFRNGDEITHTAYRGEGVAGHKISRRLSEDEQAAGDEYVESVVEKLWGEDWINWGGPA